MRDFFMPILHKEAVQNTIRLAPPRKYANRSEIPNPTNAELTRVYMMRNLLRDGTVLVHGWLNTTWDTQKLLANLIKDRLDEEKLELMKKPYDGAELQVELPDYNKTRPDALHWANKERDCRLLAHIFIDISNTGKYSEGDLESVSWYKALSQNAIPRNLAHMEHTPAQHTHRVVDGIIPKGLDPYFSHVEHIIALIHDFGKGLGLAYQDNRQHHCVISAEVFKEVCLWITQHEDELETNGDGIKFWQEPCRSQIYAAVSLHDVLGTIAGNGVFNPAEIIPLIDFYMCAAKEKYTKTATLIDKSILTEDVMMGRYRQKHGKAYPKQNKLALISKQLERRELQHSDDVLAEALVLLGDLCSADALSVPGYEHYAGVITVLYLKLYKQYFAQDHRFDKHLEAVSQRALHLLDRVEYGVGILNSRLQKYESIGDTVSHTKLKKLVDLIDIEHLADWLSAEFMPLAPEKPKIMTEQIVFPSTDLGHQALIFSGIINHHRAVAAD